MNGQYKITAEGLKRLKAGEVTLRTLAEYPAFVEFYGRKPKANTKQKKEVIATEEVEKTPIEVLEEAYSQLNNQLADDVLASLKDVSPQKFEQIVVDVLVGMGYGGSLEDAGTITAYVKDDGIDGVIKEDKLGLDKIYVQAKRWNNCVGQPEIQKFVGALVGQGAKKGVFITTSYFSKEARQFQPKGDVKVVLIDGKELANYMIECSVGVSLKQSYQIKRIDTDYFEE
jgi:restriction system protein